MNDASYKMDNTLQPFNSDLYSAIRQVLATARQSAYKAVNFAMVQAYWNIGRLIVEDEQKGKSAQNTARRFWRSWRTG